MGSAKDVVILERPVVGWVAGGVTPDGVLDAEAGGDWRGHRCSAPPCSGSARPQAAIGPRWRSIVAAEHSAPAPFCWCGLAVYPGEPAGRWRDRYRDRLGYRLQTAAMVVTWGRVIVERDCVRGQHGSVLALLVCADESVARRRRIEYAARRLGAEIVQVEDDVWPPSFGEIADRLGAPHGQRLDRGDAAALLRRRDVRRWHTTSRHHDDAGLLALHGIVLGAGLAGGGLVAIGLPVTAAAPLVGLPAIGLSVRVIRHTTLGVFQVEALASTATGERVGDPIVLTQPHPRFDPATADQLIRGPLD